MNIFGYGGRPKGIWDNPRPQYEGSWKDRDAAVQAAYDELSAMTPGATDLQLATTLTQDASAVIQVQGAAAEWSRLDLITSGQVVNGVTGGTVLGYDLETFGNTRFGKAGEFGITEFGVGTTVFREGGRFTQTGHSLAIGLSEEQAAHVRGILAKYKNQGWNALSGDEQVTMRRMSMYAGENYRSVFRQVTEEGVFKGMWEVKPGALRNADMATSLIESGIANLEQVYKEGAKSKDVLSVAMGYLQSMHQNGAVLTAANSQFDITTLTRYTGAQFTDFLSVMRDKTVDLIYGVRTAAAARSISVAEYQKTIHGKRGAGAAIQSLLKFLRFNEVETHESLSDLNQQIRLLAARNFKHGKSLAGDLAQFFKKSADGSTVLMRNGQELVQHYGQADTVFLLNRGWLDKRTGADIALIDTGNGLEATQNYSIGGEYWELDAAHTNEVTDGYRLSLKSTADGTIISKRFESKEQAFSFLQSNADWYHRDEVSSEDIANQITYKYNDRGRREFERALDPASVGIDNGKPANGFAGMEDFIKWHEAYGNKYEATPAGFHAFIADMKKTPDGFNINRANQMQGYLGAQAKVADEYKLLKMLTDGITEKFGATTITNNMQKTIALQKAYVEAMALLESKGAKDHTPLAQGLLAVDKYGIDVRMPDGAVSRIHARTPAFATRDIDRIFNKMTRQEAAATIDSFVTSGILDEKQGTKFKNLMMEAGVEAGRDASKKVALEKYLPENSAYQAYIDLGYALSQAVHHPNRNSLFLLPYGDTMHGHSFFGRMRDYIHQRFKVLDGTQNITTWLSNDVLMQDAVTSIVNNVVNNMSRVVMYDGSRTVDNQDSNMLFKDSLRQLAQDLGYKEDYIVTSKNANGTESVHNLLEDMFFKVPNEDKQRYGAAMRDKVHSVIVRPDEKGSAFVLLTNNDHYGNLMEELSKAHASDIATYKSITGSALAQHAAIYELPAVRRYTVGQHSSQAITDFFKGNADAELIVLQQSANAEKFLTTALNLRETIGDDKKPHLEAYVNTGLYDYLSSWRMTGGMALDKVEESNFEEATRLFRKQQDKKLEPLSSSSSYRGYVTVDPETGRRHIVRRPNYTPADWMSARRVRMMGEMRDIFSFSLTENAGDQRNALDVLVDTYGETFGEYRRKKETVRQYRQRISKTTYFNEFFNKNMFVGTLADDSVVGHIHSLQDKNIFTLMNDIIQEDQSGRFGDTVRDIMNQLKPIVDSGQLYQVMPGTAVEHGYVSLGMATGEYSVNGFLYDTMRPTYWQQNLARLFNPNTEWDARVFNGDRLLTLAGSPEITIAEHIGLTQSHIADGYEDQVRHIMTAFKQMDDYDLQRKYAFLEQNAGDMAKSIGISEESYREALKYMREDMISVYQDKWFIDPRLAEQEIIRAADAKKVHLVDIKRANAQRTGEVLQQLVDSGDEITANTIIGYDNKGRAMFAGDNLRTCIETFNLEDIFDITQDGDDTIYAFKKGATGYTRIIPQSPDILDMKFMFNGGEKATGHSVDVDTFFAYMQQHGITNRAQAKDVLSKMFQQVSDGATVIGHMNIEKHGGLMALDSPWRVITTEYAQSNKMQVLVDILNKRRVKHAGVGEFRIDSKGRLVSDKNHAANPVAFLLDVTNDILSNNVGDSAVNDRIRETMDYMKEHNILYGALDVMNQNEHVSDGIAIDERINQYIRQRVYALKQGAESFDQQWADELNLPPPTRQRAHTRFSYLDGIFRAWDKAVNFKRNGSELKRRNMEKSLYGIAESLVYYEDPVAFDVNSKNILQVKFQDLIDKGVIPKNGASVHELQSSLFFTDGRPSEVLKALAGDTVDFGPAYSSVSNSIYVDLGAYSITDRSGKNSIHGFLMPIQTVITDADETMFQNQQRITARMLAALQHEMQNPGDRSMQQINAKLSSIVREFYANSMRQLAVADKDSDFNKTFRKRFVANSGGMLAGQEVAPLVYNDAIFDEVTKQTYGDRLYELVDEKRAIEKRIANRPFGTDADLDDIARLDDINAEIKVINKHTADRVRAGEFLNFTQLKGTSLEGFAKEVIEVNGKKKDIYGYVAATSRQAFEDHGLNFGIFGIDIMSSLELGGKNLDEDFAKFAAGKRREIMDAINEAQIADLTITDENIMMAEIEAWARDKKFLRKFDTESLNNAISKHGAISQVAAMFDSIGVDYMKQVGIIGELVRYPTFSTQLSARFVLSDHIKDNSVVMFDPVASTFTNVDFDGDLMYALFRFNGTSGILSRNKTREYQQRYMSGLSHVPELLAQLIEDGGVLEYHQPNSTGLIMSAMLKKMDRPIYDELKSKYAEKLGLEDVTKMTRAQELAFNTSADIKEAYLKQGYNTIFSPRFQKASLASVLRKNNIGYISTTNFNARSMIQVMIDTYGAAGDTESMNKAISILNAVTYPDHTKGGLFDLAEQLAIDTKHVWEAMTTAETARYSTGMHMLFGKYSMPANGRTLAEQQQVAVEHIVSSLYNTVFKETNQGLHSNRRENILKIVEEIMNHKGDWKEYDFGGVDAVAKRAIAALLELQELDLPNNLDNLRKVFTSTFNKGYDGALSGNVEMMSEVSDLMDLYRKIHTPDAQIDPQYLDSQTYYRGFAKFLEKAISDRSLQTTSGISYAMPAHMLEANELAASDKLHDLVISLDSAVHTDTSATAAFGVFRVDKANNRLYRVDAEEYLSALASAPHNAEFKDGRLIFTGRDNGELNQILFEPGGYFANAKRLLGVSVINNNANEMYDTLKAISQAKVEQGIRHITLSDGAQIADPATILQGIQMLQDMSADAQLKFGQEEYDMLAQMFGISQANTSEVARRTSTLVRTYEYGQSTGRVASSVPSNELLTNINNEIATHPERYKDQTFDQILEQQMIAKQAFASIEQLESVRQSMLQSGNVDIATFNKTIRKLRSNVYDVDKERALLDKKYKQLFAANPYGKTKVVQDAQATVEETLAQFTEELRAFNQSSINEAQARIYDLFQGQAQASTFFRWDGNSPAGLQQVGFGMHAGRTFDSLTSAEAMRILEEADTILANVTPAEGDVVDVAFTATETAKRLREYRNKVGFSKPTSDVVFGQDQSKILEEALKKVDKLREDATIEVGTVMGESAKEVLGADKTKKKTLIGHVIGAAQEKGIKGGHVGLVLAGLAALGIVNNLLHDQETDSPLAPVNTGNSTPSFKDYYPSSPAVAQGAPTSGGTGPKTVYHANGLQFRVSASTARSANMRQQGAQMQSLTGGSTSIHVQQDMRGVTNNWLSNQFADLV